MGTQTIADWIRDNHADVFRVRTRDGEQPALDDETSLAWRDLEALRLPRCVEDEPEYFVLVPPPLGHSDYSGTAIEIANRRVFLDEHGDVPGVFEVTGGFGAQGIAIRLDVADKGIIETLAALSDYPILCEQTWSEVEMELVDEALQDWGFDDFAREVEDLFEVEVEVDDRLHALVCELLSEAPYSPSIEPGGGVVFPFTHMLDQLAELGGADELRRRGLVVEPEEGAA